VAGGVDHPYDQAHTCIGDVEAVRGKTRAHAGRGPPCLTKTSRRLVKTSRLQFQRLSNTTDCLGRTAAGRNAPSFLSTSLAINTTARHLALQLRQPAIIQLLAMSLGEEQNAGQLLDQVAQPLMSVARTPASVE
jgi:hypothetical protein